MKRIAIIEDQTAVREMIAQIVKQEPDVEVVLESGDGRHALELCMQEKPDFVVLDMMLPGLSGAELLRRITRQLPNCRVLVFSGYQDPVLLREVLEAGAHGYIGKSSALSELQKGFRVVAAGGTYFSPDVADILREVMKNPEASSNPAVKLLTAREREILQLIAESNSTKEIAAKLQISVKTAENHRTNLMKKLDLHDVASLTRFAIEYGIIESPTRPTVSGA